MIIHISEWTMRDIIEMLDAHLVYYDRHSSSMLLRNKVVLREALEIPHLYLI